MEPTRTENLAGNSDNDLPVVPDLSADDQELLQLLIAGQGQRTSAREHVLRPLGLNEAPASFSQQRLWFLDQLKPGTASYNVPAAVRLLGALNSGHLEQALTLLVARQGALRTHFGNRDGIPVQIVNEARPIRLIPIDLSHLPVAEREAAATELATREARTPFDLAVGPLMRPMFIRLSTEDHILVLNMHHSITDGWSLDILWDELGELYEACQQGTPPRSAGPDVQFTDFAAWQREVMQGKNMSRQMDYWTSRLKGFDGILDLPTDRAPVEPPAGSGAWITRSLPVDLTDRLKRLRTQHGGTLFTTLMAVFQVLLARITGQTDIGVCTPVANRNRPEIERLVGFFVNMLVIRTDLSGNPSFTELLDRVRENVFGALAHEDIPFEKIVEELNPDRDLSKRPVSPVMFGLWQHAIPESAGFGGLKLRQVDLETGTSDYSLVVTVAEQEQGLFVRVEYDTGLFDAATIERWLDHYTALMQAVVADPTERIWNLPMVDEPHLRSVAAQSRGPAMPTGTDTVTFVEMFDRQVRERPDACAVTDDEGSMTYAELDRRSDALAHRLTSSGAGPETLVAVCCERNSALIVALLGILKSGAAYVPLDPHWPSHRLLGILGDTRPVMVLASPAAYDHLASSHDGSVTLWPDAAAMPEPAQVYERVPSDPDSLAYAIFTSGSTGNPKGVMVTHRGLAHYVCWAAAHYEVDGGAGSLVHSAITFDLTVTSIFPALACGKTLTIVASDDPSALPEALLKQPDIGVLKVTPAHLTLLNQALASDELRGLARCLVIGGEALSSAVLAPWRERAGDIRLINEYGPTEAVVGCCVFEVDQSFAGSAAVPIGYPIGDTRLHILDPYGNLVPSGIPGELYISSPAVARGYLGRPDLTAERFVPDPFSNEPGARLYRTSDICRRRNDGCIEFIGRNDRQVKLRGYRIEMGEIESVLRADQDVLEATVELRQRDDGESLLVAYIVPAPTAAMTADDLHSRLARHLPDYMIPSAWVELDHMPLTAHGKIDRAALPEWSKGGLRKEERIAPRTTVEETLAAIWKEAEILDLEDLDIHDNFFHLGGHSLLATRVISRVRQALHVDVPLRTIFETPTLAGLAETVEDALEQRRELEHDGGIERIERNGPLALSYAQQRLWFLSQLQPESAFYNVPLALRIRGRLDSSILQRCIDEVVQRHEVLRTHFEVNAGRPVQIVAAQAALRLSIKDVRNDPGAEDALARWAAEEARRPFDLGSGPLLRASLISITQDDHVLVLNMHHIVADAWSLTLLIDELGQLYDAFASGRPSPLPALPVQYVDFAAWQRQRLAGSEMERQLGFWRGMLADLPAFLELAADRPRPAVQSSRGARFTAMLPRDLSDALREFSLKNNVTLFMTLLTGFAVTVGRYTRQVDIPVGTPIANRTHGDIDGLIGFFVNTLVMRIDLAGRPAFKELLERVREVSLGAYAHQELPFERLVEDIHPDRSLSHNPLFQVMFALHNAPAPGMSFAGLTLSPIDIETGTSRCDLAMSVEDGDQALQVTIEYSTDLFEAYTVSRFFHNYRTVLGAALASPGTPIANLPLTSAQERAILSTWSSHARAVASGDTVVDRFLAQAAKHPDKIALAFESETLTYRQLDESSRIVAQSLRRIMPAHGEHLVGVYMERSPRMVVAMLGIMRSGAAYLPLDPENPQERLRQIVDDARPLAIVTQAPFGLPLSSMVDCLVDIDRELATGDTNAVRVPEVRVSVDQLAYVIYTSGSTGTPKGVMIRHAGLSNLVEWHRETYDITDTDHCSQTAPSAFDASAWEIWPALAHGASLHIMPREVRSSPSEIVAWLRREGITLCFLATPLAEATLPELDKASLPLRALMTGGDRLGITRSASRSFRLVNHYGPTESTVVATWADVPPDDANPSPPIGYPVLNLRAYVLDENLHQVPIGAHGTLYIGGAGLARGYLNRADLTAEAFLPDPYDLDGGARMYRTGDRVRFNGSGLLEFLGRDDDQVKIRGYRIELGDIDAALISHPGVQSAVTIQEDGMERRLLSYVVARPDAPLTIAALRQHLKARLPAHMLPAAMSLVERLPLTGNGKVDRKQLPTIERRHELENPADAVPVDSLEAAIVKIWCRALRLDTVGVNENFFDLGGHSLLTVQVKQELEHLLKRDIPILFFFVHSTIRSMARHLGQKDESIGTTSDMDFRARQRNHYLQNRMRNISVGRRDADRP